MSKSLIRFDWAVKKLLRNKANFVVLEGFLSELLKEDIRIEKMLESEANQDSESDKFNRVDILAQNSKQEIFVIEIQNTYENDFFHRMAYGASKILTETLSRGQTYSEIKKVISINIVYFDLGQGKDYIYKGQTQFYGLHEQDILALSERQKSVFSVQSVADIFPEFYIIKVETFNDVAHDKLDEWVYFLKHSEVKDDFTAKGLREAGEVLDYMRLPEDAKYSYNRYLEFLHYKASEAESLKSIREQIAEGGADGAARLAEAESLMNSVTKAKIALDRAEMIQNFVKKSIAKGFDNATIADLTELTEKQIQAVREMFTGTNNQ